MLGVFPEYPRLWSATPKRAHASSSPLSMVFHEFVVAASTENEADPVVEGRQQEVQRTQLRASLPPKRS